MNAIALGILVFTGVCILFGLFLGCLRGANRSILRLVLVLGCAVGAFFLKDVATDALMSVDVGGQTMSETLRQSFIESGQAMPEEILSFIDVIARLLLGLMAYFVIFFALQFVSWLIVFPIFKAFVKREEDKKTGVGAIVGIIQGVVVAFVLCAPITGMLYQVNAVMTTIDTLSSMQTISAEVDLPTYDRVSLYAGEGGEGGIGEGSGELDFTALVKDFVETSPVAAVYNTTGSWYFDMLTTTTDSEGNEVKLTTTIKVMTTVVEVVASDEFGFNALINDIDRLTTCTEDETPSILRSIGDKLVTIGNKVTDLGESGERILNGLLDGVKELILSQPSDDMPPEVVDMIEGISADTLKLNNVGEIFYLFADFAEKEAGEPITQAEINRVVDVFADNSFILDTLIDMGGVELIPVESEAERTMIQNAVLSSEELTTEYKDAILKIFGLTA